MHNCKSSNWRYSKGLVIILQVKGKSHCKCSEINYLEPTYCLWLLCALRFHRYFMTPLRLFDFYFPYIECSEWNVHLRFNSHICIFLCFIYTSTFYSFFNHLSFMGYIIQFCTSNKLYYYNYSSSNPFHYLKFDSHRRILLHLIFYVLFVFLQRIKS